MPWTLEDQAANYATQNVSGTSWNPWTLVVPEHRIIFIALTVSETPDPGTITLSKPGGETNDWVMFALQTPGGGGAGERTRIYGIKTTVDWNHALTFTFAVAKQAKIANYTVFSGGSLVPRLSPTDAARQKLPWASSSLSIAFSGMAEPRESDLVIGFQCGNSPVAALDSDTTNGPWVDAGNPAAAAINSGGEDLSMRMSYKITTGRGTQTLNGPDSVGGIVLCDREHAHAITEGGDIDSSTAHPDWYFRTADAGSGPNYAAMTAGEFLLGGTHHKNYNTPITTPTGYTKYGSGKTDGTIIGTSTQVNAFQKISTLADGPKVVITTTGGLGAGSMNRIRGGVEAESEWESEAVFGADTTLAGTSIAITADNSLTVKPGDKLFYFLSVSFHDSATSIVIGGLTGCTFTQYDIGYNGYITDPDGGINMGYVEIDATPSDLPTVVTPTLAASYNSGSSAAPAAFVRVTYLLPPPEPPDDVECEDATSTSVSFSWPTPPPEEFEPTYYEVMIDGDTSVNVGLVNTYEFTGLDPSTSHILAVRACNESQCSEWIEITCDTCPPAPTNLSATDVTPTSFNLCWEQPV